jgi:hypothetical protein
MIFCSLPVYSIAQEVGYLCFHHRSSSPRFLCLKCSIVHFLAFTPYVEATKQLIDQDDQEVWQLARVYRYLKGSCQLAKTFQTAEKCELGLFQILQETLSSYFTPL